MNHRLFRFIGLLAVVFLVFGCADPVCSGPVVSVSVVNLLAIPGVINPASGTVPVVNILSDQYSGVVQWTPAVADSFTTSTSYTATITLTPSTGYTFTGILANTFTVAGAKVLHAADSGIITANFPATLGEKVSDLQSPVIGTIKGVQGGNFVYGSTEMTVSSFRMSVCEITGEQYTSVIGMADPSQFASVTNNPVESLNWYAALVFCNKLSLSEGLSPVYTIKGSTDPGNWGPVPSAIGGDAEWDAVQANWTADGYRLPTATERRFAARGGNNSQNLTYSGSNTLSEVGWYGSNSGGTTHAVGTKTANELGLFDLSGNVAEWCWDWSGSLPSTPQKDYRGQASGTKRVTQDGSWYITEDKCRVESFYPYEPYNYFNGLGFRVVRR